MKLKVKVKLYPDQIYFPERIEKGDWIDLYTNEEVNLKAPYAGTLIGNSKRDVSFDSKLISLGIGFALPWKGLTIYVKPKSSTYKKYGIILANHEGVIDNSYCGDTDEVKFNAIALRSTNIPKGSSIAQFEIRPNQFASIWTKLKWLFVSEIEFVQVDHLNPVNRGGFGSTNH